ncbi:hypothetical protein TYRP_005157 [Tyrophagus putrescentiae]|nr:hypothetical protein TYRP_005157 [Tyrophagus putrescentiae]
MTHSLKLTKLTTVKKRREFSLSICLTSIISSSSKTLPHCRTPEHFGSDVDVSGGSDDNDDDNGDNSTRHM